MLKHASIVGTHDFSREVSLVQNNIKSDITEMELFSENWMK